MKEGTIRGNTEETKREKVGRNTCEKSRMDRKLMEIFGTQWKDNLNHTSGSENRRKEGRKNKGHVELN